MPHKLSRCLYQRNLRNFLVKSLDKKKFLGYTLENVFMENVFQEMACLDDATVKARLGERED